MMVAYADDTVWISSGKTEEIVGTEVNTQLQRTGRQMRERKVEVAPKNQMRGVERKGKCSKQTNVKYSGSRQY